MTPGESTFWRMEAGRAGTRSSEEGKAMTDPYVREIGSVEDIDSIGVVVGVDYDSVYLDIGPGGDRVRLASAAQEELARLLVAAVWQAGQQSRAMAEGDISDDEDAAYVAEHGGEDMEGEHIVHHVRDPGGDESAHA